MAMIDVIFLMIAIVFRACGVRDCLRHYGRLANGQANNQLGDLWLLYCGLGFGSAGRLVSLSVAGLNRGRLPAPTQTSGQLFDPFTLLHYTTPQYRPPGVRHIEDVWGRMLASPTGIER